MEKNEAQPTPSPQQAPPQTNQVSNQPQQQSNEQSSNRPYDTIRQGTVSASIWRNIRESDNQPFYKVTFQKSYKDKASGEWRETKSYDVNDLAKIRSLSDIAYNEIAHHQEQDRLAKQNQSQENDQEKSGHASRESFTEQRQSRAKTRNRGR